MCYTSSFNLHAFSVSKMTFLLKVLSFNAGTDGILLGAETLRGLYPVETVQTVGRICAEVSFFI